MSRIRGSPEGSAGADARARRRVWIGGLGFVAWTLSTVAFSLAALPPPATPEDGGGDLVFLLVVLPFPIAGLLVLWRLPRNRIGWILLAIGYAWVAPFPVIGEFLLSRDLPGGAALVSAFGGSWAPPIVLMGTVLLLRFPDGELLSPRWRWVERLALLVLLLIVTAIALSPGDLASVGYPDVGNPLAIGGLADVVVGALAPVLLLLPVTIVLSAASLVIRFRRSRGIERLQMKWLTTSAAAIAVTYLVAMLASLGNLWGAAEEPTWVTILNNLGFVSFALIPLSIAVAVLRYRLYGIDVVISKAIVYGALALFVTAAYVGIVVGIGEAIGSDRSLPLQVVATVVVAVAFQPLRERVQRFAARLVYGRRATPYQVLAGFAERVAGTFATDEIAGAIARLLVDGTGATRAEIWLRTEGGVRLEAVWPGAKADRPAALPTGDELTRVVPVLHRGEALGDLVLRKAANDPIGPTDKKLLDDVAGQAGLVLRNVRLVEDLRASRQRLVVARDTERRKLERNIHDGAQQRLVALAVLYNMAAGIAKPLGEEHRAAIADLGVQAQGALETLRDLARGIYPAVLSDGGLIPALQAQARKSPMPVEIEPDGIGRYDQDVEAAVYFCCLEALQNVAKYARATRAVVRLAEAVGEIRFSVEDDGAGFDGTAVKFGSGTQNMRDRVAAIGGSLEVRSAPGAGTTVEGRVPVREPATAVAG